MKILLAPFAPSLAHITRCLLIAERLKDEKHECLFVVGVEGKNVIEKAGFKTVPVPEVDSVTFRKDRGWKWLTKDYFRENLLAELQIIDKFNPDHIITDFRFTTCTAASIRKKRSVSILHATAASLMLQPKCTARSIISLGDNEDKFKFRESILKRLFPEVFHFFIRRPIEGSGWF